MIHSIEIKVRGYHLDLFAHVNNARYLEFMEEARWAMFEQATDFQAFAKKGYAFTVVNININYRHPALVNQVLVIESELTRFSQRSAVIHQAIKLKGSKILVADADVTFVMIDIHQKKAAALTGELLALLKNI